MTETKISSAVASDLSSAISTTTVAGRQTDGPSGNGETRWKNTKWATYLGYYKEIPEIKAIIDAKATWTVGKGFKADDETTMILDTIKGFGKDTTNTILENLARVMEIGGDSFTEIILDDEDNLINLKPLDPGTIETITNEEGIIIRYEQTTKTKEEKVIKFTPDQILHVPRNRVADEIHGTSMLESLEWIILAKKEIQEVTRTVMRRYIKPVMIYHLDTDDPTEIAAFKTKMDKINEDGENLYIPKDVVVPEVLAVAPNATLSPFAWLDWLDNQLYQASKTPKIIVGGSSEFVEKATAIVYLAFQQTIEESQLQIEEQFLAQVNLLINLEFPASMQGELLSDKEKDGPPNIDPSKSQAGQGQ